jgi:hypothetical protein
LTLNVSDRLLLWRRIRTLHLRDDCVEQGAVNPQALPLLGYALGARRHARVREY